MCRSPISRQAGSQLRTHCQRLLRAHRRVRCDQQVDVTAAPMIVGARAEEQHAAVGGQHRLCGVDDGCLFGGRYPRIAVFTGPAARKSAVDSAAEDDTKTEMMHMELAEIIAMRATAHTVTGPSANVRLIGASPKICPLKTAAPDWPVLVALGKGQDVIEKPTLPVGAMRCGLPTPQSNLLTSVL